MKDLLSSLDTQIQKASQALTKIPEGDKLAERAAWVELKEWNITKRRIEKLLMEMGGKKFNP